MLRIFVIIINIILLTSCASTLDRLARVGEAPELKQTDMPFNDPDYQDVKYKEQEENFLEGRTSNSLWQPGARTFFRDQRARRVGDIVKINIKIEDKADLNNKSEAKRTTKENVAAPNFLGYESIFKKKTRYDLDSLVSINGGNNHAGEGKITRKESIQTQVAAMVTQILPNGNLVIKGKQEIRVNYELREILVQGIARPEDISLDNAISSDQVAELRISYGGRGNMSDIQQPRLGTQIIDIFSPF